MLAQVVLRPLVLECVEEQVRGIIDVKYKIGEKLYGCAGHNKNCI